MKANELRIDNLIYLIQGEYNSESDDFNYSHPLADDIISVSTSILTDVEKAEKWDNGYKFEPIPLTDEWLSRFGKSVKELGMIILSNQYWGILIDQNKDGVSWDVSARDEYCIANISYVHQLQNLYFALTGTDLTLNQ